MKKYIAKTNVSVNVVMPSGKNKHISFSPLSSGGSVYYTDNADEQAALEGHYKYGKLFMIEEATQIVNRNAKPTSTQTKTTTEEVPGIELNEAVISDTFDEISSAEELPNLHQNVKIVTDFEDARNWLSETYGVSRTKLRSLKNVKEYAASVGVELQGI